MTRFSTSRSDRTERLWPVLALLLIVVLVPTISVLWFMTKAVENERLAVRQTLSEVLRLKLADTQNSVDERWEETLEAISTFASKADSPGAFESVVSDGLADSVVLYGADGQVMYPNTPEFQPPALEESAGPWLAAERAEYADRDPATAAELYSVIAQDSTDVNLAARALAAELRCRAGAGQNDSAIALVTETLQATRYESTTAINGRLIVPNTQALALSLMGGPDHPEFDSTVERLQERLSNYGDVAMTSAQRRFLMRELQELAPSMEAFPTLRAEQLAALYVDAEISPAQSSVLRPAGVSDLWHIASPDGRVVALYSEETVASAIESIIGNQSIPRGTVIEVLAPGKTPEPSSPVVGISTSRYLPDWRLSVRFEDSSVFDSAADGRIASYLWTGVLVIAAALILAAILAYYMTRQLRLARLKNDLLATVSHELKTPLSSMRVFVDTLLNGKSIDPKTTREYLQIISKENARLTHLIDNFLNYSRMSRNRPTFNFTEVNPSDLVNSAIEVVAERLESASFQFEKDIQINLPTIEADAGAITTALINLLENAYKYSSKNKQVKLLAYQHDHWVCFEVVDCGIGLTKREKARIFGKFYRVDQSLSTGTSGVGLGLSIVRFIVGAHGGSISVESQAGHGSAFTIKIPTARTKNPHKLSKRFSR